MSPVALALLFFFNDPATTEIYTLSLHDALPISEKADALVIGPGLGQSEQTAMRLNHLSRLEKPMVIDADAHRSEEHTSELQSHVNLVCRLLLEKKKKKKKRQKKIRTNEETENMQ